jgi:GABA(A) receptor-associated protein
MFKFKKENSEEKRISESDRILKKYPNRIPVIVEKDPRSKLNDIDKNKFLVPNDMNFSQFIYVIRKRIKLLPEEALFLFVNGQIAANGSSMNNIYQTHKDKDGFIYITYTSENTFG